MLLAGLLLSHVNETILWIVLWRIVYFASKLRHIQYKAYIDYARL